MMSNTELLNQLLSITIWKQIEDYPNYETSICGQVRNITTKRILRPRIRSGYYAVDLYKKGEAKTFPIHRLVANTFIPKVDVSKNCVDHIDCNRLNNTISNLRWCTIQQNNFNFSLSKQSTTGVKGVVWIESNKKYRAKISYNNRTIYLGSFINIDDAIIARKKKSAELFGDYQNECEK